MLDLSWSSGWRREKGTAEAGVETCYSSCDDGDNNGVYSVNVYGNKDDSDKTTEMKT